MIITEIQISIQRSSSWATNQASLSYYKMRKNQENQKWENRWRGGQPTEMHQRARVNQQGFFHSTKSFGTFENIMVLVLVQQKRNEHRMKMDLLIVCCGCRCIVHQKQCWVDFIQIVNHSKLQIFNQGFFHYRDSVSFALVFLLTTVYNAQLSSFQLSVIPA